MRQKEHRVKAERPGGEKWTRSARKVTVHNGSEDGRPSSLPKDPQNIAESEEVQRQRETEAP